MTQSQDITTPEQSLPPLRVIYSWATEYHAGWELCLYGAGSVSFRNEFTSAIWAVPEGLIHWATARIAPAPDPNSVVEKK